MTTDILIFLGLAFVAVVSALAMLASRSAVYSALFLVINFFTIALLFLSLNAAFLAMVQVTVYAGAIMVLFLFVIMLLGAEHVETSRDIPWQRPLAIILGLILLGEFGWILLGGAGVVTPAAGLPEAFGSPLAVGEMLFDRYLIPFEVTSVLLLVAMVGAIVLTRQVREEQRR